MNNPKDEILPAEINRECENDKPDFERLNFMSRAIHLIDAEARSSLFGTDKLSDLKIVVMDASEMMPKILSCKPSVKIHYSGFSLFIENNYKEACYLPAIDRFKKGLTENANEAHIIALVYQ